MPTATVSLTTRVTEETQRRFEVLAHEEHMSVSAFLRSLVNEALNRRTD